MSPTQGMRVAPERGGSTIVGISHDQASASAIELHAQRPPTPGLRLELFISMMSSQLLGEGGCLIAAPTVRQALASLCKDLVAGRGAVPAHDAAIGQTFKYDGPTITAALPHTSGLGIGV